MLTILNSYFVFSSRRRHTRLQGDWSSDVCSSDLLSTSPASTRLAHYSAGCAYAGCAGQACVVACHFSFAWQALWVTESAHCWTSAAFLFSNSTNFTLLSTLLRCIATVHIVRQLSRAQAKKERDHESNSLTCNRQYVVDCARHAGATNRTDRRARKRRRPGRRPARRRRSVEGADPEA